MERLGLLYRLRGKAAHDLLQHQHSGAKGRFGCG